MNRARLHVFWLCLFCTFYQLQRSLRVIKHHLTSRHVVVARYLDTIRIRFVFFLYLLFYSYNLSLFLCLTRLILSIFCILYCTYLLSDVIVLHASGRHIYHSNTLQNKTSLSYHTFGYLPSPRTVTMHLKQLRTVRILGSSLLSLYNCKYFSYIPFLLLI
jgi:hypothetical protein